MSKFIRGTLAGLVGSLLFVSVASQVGCAGHDKSGASKHGQAKAGIMKSEFGKTKDGQSVDLYTLTNRHGMVAKITNFGGIITEIRAPDRNGKFEDVVLGFDNLDQYTAGHPFFGAIAGRYANRIAKGKFTLDGKTYTLAVNNGPNHLHGGEVGFDKKVWEARGTNESAGPTLKLRYISADGEEGYPGKLTTYVTYTLTDDNALKIDYEAKTDKPTVLNITNHSYFNLAGENSGSIADHVLYLNSKEYTQVDDTLIPTGEYKKVKGTPLDFTKPTPIGERMKDIQDKTNGGYDHNFLLDHPAHKVALAARVMDPASGRVMEVWTDQPAVQLYTGNFLDGTLTGIGGKKYEKFGAFCLETQHYPDSPNHQQFPSTVLRPGDTFKSETIYKFSTK